MKTDFILRNWGPKSLVRTVMKSCFQNCFEYLQSNLKFKTVFSPFSLYGQAIPPLRVELWGEGVKV